MPNYCSLRTCPNRDLKTFPHPNDGLSKEDIRCVYHFSFPKHSYEILMKWMDFVNKFNRTNISINVKSSYICSLHFEDEEFVEYGKLDKDAVPTIPPPKFSAEIAYKFHLIPHLDSKLLDFVNDFNLSQADFITLPSESHVSDLALKNKIAIRVGITQLRHKEKYPEDEKNDKFCILRACPNHQVKELDHRTKWFSIPFTTHVATKWTDFINRCNRTHDFQPQPGASHAHVCSLHFDESCYLSSSQISKNAVPTIAPKYTAETAYNYNLIPHLDSEFLDDVNDFERGLEDLFHLTPGPLNPELDNDINEGVEEPSSTQKSPARSESSLFSYDSTSDLEPKISDSQPYQILKGEDREDLTLNSNHQADINEVEVDQEVSMAYDWASSNTTNPSDSVFSTHRETGRSVSLAVNKNESQIQHVKASTTRGLSDSDFSSPLKTIRSLALVKKESTKAQQRIKTLKQKLVHGRSQIKDIFFLLRRLKREGSVTHQAASLLLKGLEEMYVSLYEKPNQ